MWLAASVQGKSGDAFSAGRKGRGSDVGVEA